MEHGQGSVDSRDVVIGARGAAHHRDGSGAASRGPGESTIWPARHACGPCSACLNNEMRKLNSPVEESRIFFLSALMCWSAIRLWTERGTSTCPSGHGRKGLKVARKVVSLEAECSVTRRSPSPGDGRRCIKQCISFIWMSFAF